MQLQGPCHEGTKFFKSNFNLLLQNRASLDIFFACQKVGGHGSSAPPPRGKGPELHLLSRLFKIKMKKVHFIKSYGVPIQLIHWMFRIVSMEQHHATLLPVTNSNFQTGVSVFFPALRRACITLTLP